MATAAYFIGMQIRMRREATRSDRVNPARNDVNLPGLATTETLTRCKLPASHLQLDTNLAPKPRVGVGIFWNGEVLGPMESQWVRIVALGFVNLLFGIGALKSSISLVPSGWPT